MTAIAGGVAVLQGSRPGRTLLKGEPVSQNGAASSKSKDSLLLESAACSCSKSHWNHNVMLAV